MHDELSQRISELNSDEEKVKFADKEKIWEKLTSFKVKSVRKTGIEDNENCWAYCNRNNRDNHIFWCDKRIGMARKSILLSKARDKGFEKEKGTMNPAGEKIGNEGKYQGMPQEMTNLV